MAAIQDQDYVKRCAQLASVLGISLASARRLVDQKAAREGTRDPERRRVLAEDMLEVRWPNGPTTTTVWISY